MKTMDPNMILSLKINNKNRESFAKITFNLNCSEKAYNKSTVSVIFHD